MGMSLYAFAQGTFSISGIVSDNQGPLPGASIYVSGYQMGTSTDNEGKFILPKLAPGTYDILIQMIGYLPYKQRVIISKESEELSILLKEDAKLLNEIVVKAKGNDKSRDEYMKLFLEIFIGKTPNSNQCEIKNPDAISFTFDPMTGVLRGTARELLIIENKALGYNIKYLLETFEFNKKAKVYFFAGQPFFEEVKTTAAKQKKWVKAREEAYYGSRQHFFKSLYNKTVTQEGFIVNKVSQSINPDKLPTEVIEANIKRLSIKPQTAIRSAEVSLDSLAYWVKQREMPTIVNNFDTAKVNLDTLLKPSSNTLKQMNYSEALYVIYTKERESNNYSTSGNLQERPIGVPNYQISIINRREPTILFYPNGNLYSTKSVLYQGYWAYEKLGDMVPFDYEPLPKLTKTP